MNSKYLHEWLVFYVVLPLKHCSMAETEPGQNWSSGKSVIPPGPSSPPPHVDFLSSTDWHLAWRTSWKNNSNLSTHGVHYIHRHIGVGVGGSEQEKNTPGKKRGVPERDHSQGQRPQPSAGLVLHGVLVLHGGSWLGPCEQGAPHWWCAGHGDSRYTSRQ